MPYRGLTSTFTPLRRNRLRCNQTGKILRKDQVAGYRSQRANVDKKSAPLNLWRPDLLTVSGTFYFGETDFRCPHCGHMHYVIGKHSGTATCEHCKKKFNVKS